MLLRLVTPLLPVQGLIDTASEAIECIERACQQIMAAERLHKVLAVVLTVGNTLNWGTHRGNANGIRLESLHKLADMKVAFCPCSSVVRCRDRSCLLPQHANRSHRGAGHETDGAAVEW